MYCKRLHGPLNSARQQQLCALLPELAVTLLEAASCIGLISMAKTIFGALTCLALKRKAILDITADMAEKFKMIREYLDDYSTAVQAWSTAAANHFVVRLQLEKFHTVNT